ncbi:hypothetical protein [Plantactinospora sp. GCM10030261]|uniref:hypothetical protein n=1 Tax=Plantactinospora sp. GCM10030261 TaxID=3273420 RepID=UPI00361ABCD4
MPQLEVDIDSPWGGFVHARFEELWQHEQATLTLDQYWSTAVTLRHGDSDVVEVRVPYVSVDDQHYIDCQALRLTRPLTVRAHLPLRTRGSSADVFALVEPAEDDRAPAASVRRVFDQKYGRGSGDRIILRLAPDRPTT